MAVGRKTARGVEAIGRWIRRLARSCIFARCLAEILRISFDVEDVVDDLKRKSEMPPVFVDRANRFFGAAAHDGAGDGCRADERTSLARVHVLQRILIER